MQYVASYQKKARNLGRNAAEPAVSWEGEHMLRQLDGDPCDVPLFALLRSTVGLPVDDPQWWPEGLPGADDLVQPNVELLERTLVALRAWGDEARTVPGRHVLRVVPGLLSRQ